MMEGWKEYILEDLGFVGRGKSRHRPRNEPFLYGDKYPFVQTADVKSSNNRISTYTQMYSEKGLKQSKLWPVNTLCITIAANIADAAILDIEACFPDSIIGFIPDSKKSDVQFVKYLFDLLQVSIKQISQGAAQDNLSLEKLRSIKFLVPPLPTQNKIASILSAYDDLIENNLQRIKLLEEMAQQTYTEWFVRMKFPGHESVEWDEETGLPEGWERKSLDTFCSKITDGTHDSPKQVSTGYKLITGKHISDGFIDFETAYTISEKDHLSIRKRSGLEKGDILFSNIGTLGNIGVVTEDFEYSCKNVIIFKHKENYSNFLYTYLSNSSTKQKLSNQSAGVAQKFYSLKFIRNLNDFFPSKTLIQKFDEEVRPIYKLKYNLHNQNQLLKEARDILLPRLMTGMIEV